jgi:hypothetical protein
VLGLSKSGVNDFLNRVNRPNKSDGPNVLLLDIETAPSIAVAFNRYDVILTQDHILQEGGFLLSTAWNWLDQDEIESDLITPNRVKKADDSTLCANMHSLFDKADIVIAHNAKGFDIKQLRTRMVVNGLPPLKNVKVIDTLQIAKTMKFNSNKLDSLCVQLGLESKLKHSGIKLWIECIQGNTVALNKMKEYNIQDVKVLKELYLLIRAYDKAPPNFGLYYDDGYCHCPVCGSTNLVETDQFVYANLSKYPEVLCSNCGHRSRGSTGLMANHQKANLLRRA